MIDKIVTTVALPSQAPSGMPAGDVPSWIFFTAASAIATLLWLRRRTSRDSTEIAKDRAEENLVKTLREERDRAMVEAREAWDRRTADAQKIAGLEAANGYLTRDVERLGSELNAVKDQLAELRKQLGLGNPGAPAMTLQPKA